MKTSIRLAMGAAALTIILQASPAMAGPPAPCAHPWNGACTENGFGSRTPVTLPGDRHPPSGKDTGILIRGGARPTIPPPNYFRPK
jgi:hypothetical protein